MKVKTLKKIFLIFAVGILVSACGWVHKIDVQQGNIVEQTMIDKLKPGMTADKIRYIMGTPLLIDVFHQKPKRERWDYYYSLEKSGKLTQRRRITLILQDDRLQHIEGDVKLPSHSKPEEEDNESNSLL